MVRFRFFIQNFLSPPAGAITAFCFILSLAGLPPLLGQNVSIDRQDVLDMLKDASEDVRNHFYDPNLKGLNWDALVDETKKRI